MVLHNLPQQTYQSPPGSGNNDGAIPTVYDPGWPIYTNLTKAQIMAFQSFPQDLAKYAAQRRWMAEISGTTVGGIPLNTQDRDQQKIAALMQAFDKGIIVTTKFKDAAGNSHTVDATAAAALYTGVVQFIDALYLAEAGLANATTRAQIDAAFAAISPNSPSATNPSPN